MKTIYVESLPDQVVNELKVIYSNFLIEQGYDEESIPDHVQNFLDSKIDDVQDCLPPDVYDYIQSIR